MKWLQRTINAWAERRCVFLISKYNRHGKPSERIPTQRLEELVFRISNNIEWYSRPNVFNWNQPSGWVFVIGSFAVLAALIVGGALIVMQFID